MKSRISLAAILGALLLLFGAGLRLANLGWLPLTPAEARTALTVTAGTELGSPFWQGSSVSSAPAYSHLTGIVMGALGAEAGTARLVPALAGVGLLLLPVFLWRRLGALRTLFAVAILAISPTMITVARTAGPASLAALAVGTALVLLLRRDPADRRTATGAGIALGTGLLAGPEFWTGALGLAVGGGVAWAVTREDRPEWPGLLLAGLRRAVPAALITVAVIGTGFGARLSGLGGVPAAAGEWWMGWLGGARSPLLISAALLPLYEPLVSLLAVGGAAVLLLNSRAEWRAPLFWAIGALVAYLIYPARAPADLIWIVLPASLLAANGLEFLVERVNALSMPLTVLILATVVLGLLAFAHLMFEAADSGLVVGGLVGEVRFGYGLMGLAFSAALLLLFGFGWSWRETWLALGVALTFAFTMLSLSHGWQLNFDRSAATGRHYWRSEVSTLNVPVLEDTLHALAIAHVGRKGGLPVDVHGAPAPTVAWVLRDQEPAEPGPAQPPPPVVLAPAGSEPPFSVDYMGQGFAVVERRGWPGLLPPDPLGWWLDREGPTESERWILYVRTDVATLGGGTNLDQGN